MPYIRQERREALDSGDQSASSGELNYVITSSIRNYLRSRGVSYQYINDVLGALEAAKLEFYRRIVIPYESKKIVENGDVY